MYLDDFFAPRTPLEIFEDIEERFQRIDKFVRDIEVKLDKDDEVMKDNPYLSELQEKSRQLRQVLDEINSILDKQGKVLLINKKAKHTQQLLEEARKLNI